VAVLVSPELGLLVATGLRSWAGSRGWKAATSDSRGLHTPADVHYGTAETVRDKRATVLDDAYRAHPERFVRNPPEPPKLPTHTWINPPDPPEEAAH
jgi:hypothetical protein